MVENNMDMYHYDFTLCTEPANGKLIHYNMIIDQDEAPKCHKCNARSIGLVKWKDEFVTFCGKHKPWKINEES